jgi:hypothetical protein
MWKCDIKSFILKKMIGDKMSTAVKDKVKKIIDNLPDDSTIDDVMHALYIQAKLERAEMSIDDGNGISHEDAKKRLQKWLK